MSTKAIYAGSFDPFTLGHEYVLCNAMNIFDEVLVMIPHSDKRRTDIHHMAEQITSYYGVEVIIFNELVAEYAHNHGCEYLVRGLRNNVDYNYEENIAKINSTINSDLKTVYIRANNDAISSSMVWELRKYNHDYSKYIPFDFKANK